MTRYGLLRSAAIVGSGLVALGACMGIMWCSRQWTGYDWPGCAVILVAFFFVIAKVESM